MREDVDRIERSVRAIGGERADVMVLQEVVERSGRPSVAHQLAERFGLEVVYRSGSESGDGGVPGLATLARFPISDARVLRLKRFNVTFRPRDRIALAVTIATSAGPLRTYNVHLDTRINAGDRLAQLEGVVADFAASPEMTIVAGDFNTNRHRWLFHTIPLPFIGRQAHGLEAFMARHGLRSAFDAGSTHDVLGMRLDWMFLKGVEASARAIHPIDVSDHHALMVSVVSDHATAFRQDGKTR